MYLEDISKELDSLEIDDLDSAIKGIILGDLQCTLEDSSDNAKIKFLDGKDVDTIVYELDDYVGELISNYLADNIEIVNDKGKDDICL